MEIFVIYDKETGFIDGGCGRVNRDATPDGTTMAERIPEILAKDPDREVIYLPDQPLPDPEKHKIVDGEIVEYFPTPEEAALEQQTKATTAIQNMLDTKCLEYEFDNINNATGWAPYYSTAMALTLWGKACWDKATEIRNDVIAEIRPMPTVEEVLSEMPVFTWPE